MAKGPGGKSVGRVSIRVVPDTSRVREELKKALGRIEKSAFLHVQVKIDTASLREELAKARRKTQSDSSRKPITVPTAVADLDRTWTKRLQAQVQAATKNIEANIPAGVDGEHLRAELQSQIEKITESLHAEIPTDPTEAAEFRKKVNELVDDINSRSARIDVDADTTAAVLHIKEIARKRRVELAVSLSKASVAKVSSTLAALSGARLAGDMVRNIGESLSNLDRSLPKLAGVVAAIGSIGAVALSSVGGLATLAVSLASLAGLAAPLPGILGGLATGLVVFGVALSDAGEQLATLSPVWSRLKSTISDNFWAKARQPIIDFVQATLPQLQSGLAGVSSSLGTWTASVANGFKEAFGGGVLDGMLSKLRESIDIAATGTGGFASAIATLGTFGAQYLPRLAQWFADITNSFDGWIARVAGDGTLAGWVESGLEAARQLGSVLASTVSIIGGVASAATAAGGGGLATFAAVMATIAETVNSPVFQTTLATLFQGAAAGVQGLMTALVPLGDMFSALAPTLSSVMSTIGSTLGEVVGQIAAALSTPEVSSGLTAMVQGLADGITAILPSLPAVASALASVATFAGALAAQLGPVLGAVMAALAPVISELLTALEPLLPVLGEALVTIIQAASPLLAALVPIISAIVPVVAQLVEVFAPIVAAILPVLADLLLLMVPIIQQFAGVWGQILEAAMPVIEALLPPLLSLMSALFPVISQVAGTVFELLEPILQLIAPLLQLIGPVLGPLIEGFKSTLPVFASVVGMLKNLLLPAITMITGVLQGLIQFVSGVFSGDWQKAWNGIVQIFTSIWNGISAVGRGVINTVIDIINNAINGVNDITSKVGIPKIPKIPRLALGADIEPSLGGTAVIVGEGGRKETVTDYGRTNQLIELANAMAARALSQEPGPQRQVTQNIYPQQDDPTRQMRGWLREAERGAATV